MPAADALPRFHVRSRHELPVAAPPDVALAAVRGVTAREAPLLRALFALRGLRPPPETAVWEALRSDGFVPFDDVTLVAVGRPWKLRGALRPGAGFAGFSEPGWAKIALDLRVEEGRLVTETRVFLTDAAALRAFRRYWLLVRPFSALVRRSWLAAARRRAEREAGAGA